VGGSDKGDDARAVRATLDGDRDAFEPLVRRYQREIALYCHSQVLDPLVAEELAQNAFLRAYERLRQLNQHEHFRAWLYRIAATVVHTHRRRRREEPIDAAHLDLATGTVEQYEVERQNDMRQLAEEALRHLPEEARATVVLRLCEDLSYKEIAERLHIDPTTAESRVRRGVRAMRAHLTRMGREEEVRDVLRYGIAAALAGSDIVASVMERIAGMPDPRDPNSKDRDLRTSAALSLVVVSTLFVGIGAISTSSAGSDAPNVGLRAASMTVASVSDITFGDVFGPPGVDGLTNSPRGALYDFESGDLTGWTGRHYNRRLDRFHAIADAVLHVQKFTLDNPVIPGSKGLLFRKEDKGAYLLSALSTPSFGPLTEPFVAEWDVLLGDDNYGMYLAETSPHAADSQAEVMLAGVYFSGGRLTAAADGFPAVGTYAPDSLYHVRVDVRPRAGRFTLTVEGGGEAAYPGVRVQDLRFAGDYRHTGVRHLVFVMGRAAAGKANLDSLMILDNIEIHPTDAPGPGLIASGGSG
jgi:RNA polymerase sigma-70 factor, ECF subfamily